LKARQAESQILGKSRIAGRRDYCSAGEFCHSRSTIDRRRERSRQLVIEAERRGVTGRGFLSLRIQVREAVTDDARETGREYVSEIALQRVRVGANSSTCTGGCSSTGTRGATSTRTFETQHAITRGEIQRVPGTHLPGHTGTECVGPRLLSTGGKALARQVRVAIQYECISSTQRQCRRHPIETAAYEILTIERVVEAIVPRIHHRAERIAGIELVRGAVDVEGNGWPEGTDEIRLPVPVVQEDIVVVLLADRDRGCQRHGPSLRGRAQKPQELDRIRRDRRDRAGGDRSRLGRCALWLRADVARLRFLGPRVGRQETERDHKDVGGPYHQGKIIEGAGEVSTLKTHPDGLLAEHGDGRVAQPDCLLQVTAQLKPRAIAVREIGIPRDHQVRR